MLAGRENDSPAADYQGSLVMIAIVDYGAGNPVSVKKALDWLGQECSITSDPKVVATAARIVLPGVGHFAATKSLGESGLEEAIAGAIARGTPFLGICVGMQWMFEHSHESPQTSGLGIFDGECEHFPAEVKSPHVGWNHLDVSASSQLLQGIPSQSFVYFSHSFRAPLTSNTVASCEYGGKFSAAVERDHLFGVQFHPEKSGDVGLHLLRNFCEL
jgi:glutamine amidotransferase